MTDDSEWFAPKRYGIGAGLPISWQGWATDARLIAAVVVAVASEAGRIGLSS